MLDFIKDIFAAFRQNSLERMKSPFLGAFVFSWIGFNWQLLAILFFSKKVIEERIAFINQHFDVGSLILGPLCTTIIICLILPQATKYIVRMQSKPISDAILTTMSEKIALAEKQLEIADIESRKRLSDKREERKIEEDINAIKKDISDLLAENSELINEIQVMKDKLHQSQLDFNSSETRLLYTSNQLSDLQKTLKFKEDSLLSATQDLYNLNAKIVSLDANYEKAVGLLNTLRKEAPKLFNESSAMDGEVTFNIGELYKLRALYKINENLRD
ncbi:hypothetical protein J1779_15080 [Rahnella sp. FC061912-K]|uniref:hypothetical protein n=1 Tax=Rahnella rivi TaxID=2816249 RepID=UPI001C25BC20|nr:hypothetical protein [Rahnella rivi]MBU9831259.1 hypothetical protein [Rahnella rivi]